MTSSQLKDLSVGVVIPTFNSPEFLEAAVRSVVEQDHRPVRILVMDGGNDAETAQTMQMFSDQLEWYREPDRGQADAIRKGFERLDTDLVGWLNADDILLPHALSSIVKVAVTHQDAVLIYGNVERIGPEGRPIGTSKAIEVSHDILRKGRGRVVQPGSFMRRSAVLAAGNVDPSFHLLMDLDLWIRLLKFGNAYVVPQTLAQFRVHPQAKSSQPPFRYYAEGYRIVWKHEQDRIARGLVRRSVHNMMHFVRWLVARSGVFNRS